MQIPPNPKDPEKSGPKVPPVPEMVGATGAPFYLSEAITHITIEMHMPTGPALLRADKTPRRIFLNIENITSAIDAPSYEVYLNLPQGAEPQKHQGLHVGILALFGVIESSRPDGKHPGNGLTYNLEVTGLFHRLAAAKDWDAKNLRVSFVPEPWPIPAKVKVGRVSLYFQ
jgi:tyrosinase